MRNGKGLVQVEVGNIAAELAWAGPAGQRVHIRTVDVDLAAHRVDLIAYVADLGVKDTVGGRVGHHDAGDVVAVLGNLLIQIRQVNRAILGGLDHNNAQVSQRCRSRIGTVRGSWDEHYIALVIAIGYVVAADGQKTRQLALGAGIGLDGDLGITSDLGQPALNLFYQGAPTGGRFLWCVGVDACKLRPGNRLHGGGGVELHGAGAQRNHGAVERQVLIGQLAQVAQHLGLGMDAVEDLVLEWLLATLQVLRQGKVGLSSFGAEGLGELGDVLLGRRLTKGHRYLVLADGAHEVALLLEVSLDGGGVYAGDGHGIEEVLGHELLSGILDGLRKGGSERVDALGNGREALRTVVDGIHGGDIG